MIQDSARRQRVAAKTGGNCFYGRQPLPPNWVEDHYIPRAKGGRDAESNLVASCPKHNAQKADQDPEAYIQFLRSRPSEAICGS